MNSIAYIRLEVFRCCLCWRVISWSFGGCDGLCDDCWYELSKRGKHEITATEDAFELDNWSWDFEEIITPPLQEFKL